MGTKRERVDQAVRAVRAFHDLGRRSLAARPGRGPHGSGSGDREAKRLGVNADHLRKARVFADAESGYDGTELDALCRAVREHFDTFDDRGTKFGTGHVMRLLSVPKADGKRDEVQALLFEGGWSVAELGAEIRRRSGHRHAGGRRRRVGGRAVLLDQLEVFCESWQRWYEQLSTGNDDTTKPIDVLPDGVRGGVVRVEKAVAALHTAVRTASSAQPEPSENP